MMMMAAVSGDYYYAAESFACAALVPRRVASRRHSHSYGHGSSPAPPSRRCRASVVVVRENFLIKKAPLLLHAPFTPSPTRLLRYF